MYTMKDMLNAQQRQQTLKRDAEQQRLAKLAQRPQETRSNRFQPTQWLMRIAALFL